MAFASPQRRTRRLSRCAWLAALCVVLGFVTSVGVAWVTAAIYPAAAMSFHPVARYATDRDGLDGKLRLRVSEAIVPGARLLYFDVKDGHHIWEDRLVDSKADFDRFTNDASSRAALRQHAPLIAGEHVYSIRFFVQLSGWPYYCLGCEDPYTGDEVCVMLGHINPDLRQYFNKDGGGVTKLPPISAAIRLNDGLLPLRPLWPGLLADTGLFAGAWAVLIFTPLGIRQWLRARRGGCPQCGYSREGLKDDALCPECGRAVA